jgi:hypothetical protein
MSNVEKLAKWYQDEQKKGLTFFQVSTEYGIEAFLNKNGSSQFDSMSDKEQKAEIERVAGDILFALENLDDSVPLTGI